MCFLHSFRAIATRVCHNSGCGENGCLATYFLVGILGYMGCNPDGIVTGQTRAVGFVVCIGFLNCAYTSVLSYRAIIGFVGHAR
jgi:hypothetical protein